MPVNSNCIRMREKEPCHSPIEPRSLFIPPSIHPSIISIDQIDHQSIVPSEVSVCGPSHNLVQPILFIHGPPGPVPILAPSPWSLCRASPTPFHRLYLSPSTHQPSPPNSVRLVSSGREKEKTSDTRSITSVSQSASRSIRSSPHSSIVEVCGCVHHHHTHYHPPPPDIRLTAAVRLPELVLQAIHGSDYIIIIPFSRVDSP